MRPMTAQMEDAEEGQRGPIWFFTATDNAIVQKLQQHDRHGDRAKVAHIQ